MKQTKSSHKHIFFEDEEEKGTNKEGSGDGSTKKKRRIQENNNNHCKKLPTKTKNIATPNADANSTKEEEEERGMEAAKGEQNAFDMVPNELLVDILLHLPPIWYLVCKSVCQRWRLLLAISPSLSSYSSEFVANLAFRGHLQVLQWARSQGCPWDARTCPAAADGGHLEVLQWLRSQGCPWDGWTCANAAYRGHLEVLQWARSQGCPWNEWTCANAARGGHLGSCNG